MGIAALVRKKGCFVGRRVSAFFTSNAVESVRVVGMTQEIALLRPDWRADGYLHAVT